MPFATFPEQPRQLVAFPKHEEPSSDTPLEDILVVTEYAMKAGIDALSAKNYAEALVAYSLGKNLREDQAEVIELVRGKIDAVSDAKLH